LRARPASYKGGTAHLPWVKRPSPVFLAASHPRSLEAAGARADGVFINYGLAADNVAESEAKVARAARVAGRDPNEVEIWQIACLDCGLDGDASRRKIGAILAFVSAYVMGGGDLARRGVPAEHRAALQELRRRYSTRPGDADAALVAELGLFDYLSRRLAVCGTPDECLAQVRAAQAAGVRRLMFSVSLAVDPVRTGASVWRKSAPGGALMGPSSDGGRRYIIVGIVWLLAAFALGASGHVASWRPPVPQIVLLGLTALVLMAFVALPRFRGWLRVLDLRWLVALHVTRFVGAYFLVVYYRDAALPRAFAVPGGWGDIIVATLALGSWWRPAGSSTGACWLACGTRWA
jgi:hypothetical protein